MSGIFGCIGKSDCKAVLAQGIAALNSRGGEITGAALKTENGIIPIKIKGSSKSIAEKIITDSECCAALAQTDAAYRTRASAMTAPPACGENFAVCLDGRIKNFFSLASWCGNPFPVVTDEDLFLALLCLNDRKDRPELLKKTTDMLSNRPTAVFLASDENAIYCFVGDMPLFLGVGDNCFFVASQLNALLHCAKKYAPLHYGDCVKITKERVTVTDKKGRRAKRSLAPCPENRGTCVVQGGGLACCPLVVKDALNCLENGKVFDNMKFSKRAAENLRQIIVVAGGCSYYAAGAACSAFRKMTVVPVTLKSGAEFCSGTVLDRHTLVVAADNGGEDSRILSALQMSKKFKAHTVLLTARKYSAAALFADDVAVLDFDFASDGAQEFCFFADYLGLTMLSLWLGKKCGVVSQLYSSVAAQAAGMLPGRITLALKNYPALNAAADAVLAFEKVIVCGCTADEYAACYAAKILAREAGVNALSCELSQAEQKFCTIIGESCLVVGIINDGDVLGDALSYLRRLRACGSEILIFTASNFEQEIVDFDNIVSFSDSLPVFNALSCAASLYETALIAAEKKKRLPTGEIAV